MDRSHPPSPARSAEALQLRFDVFELDETNARLMRAGVAVELPPKAFAVLCALARSPGRLVTKDTLLDAVWGHRHVSESVLKTTISQLRAALDDDAKEPRVIETAARRGYRFICAVSAPAAARAPNDPAAVPAPTLVAPARKPADGALIGRADALSRLRAAWDAAAAGQRQIFWLAGDAGVGKTTLIEHFVAKLGAVACAHGHCVEQYGAGEPYLPVLEALAALCRSDPTLVSMLRAAAPTWLLQMPWLSSEAEREALRRELVSASQDRMLRELGELFDRYTDQRALLLVTEDLHWSDHATVHLIDHIARRRSPARLMWLASFRLAEVISLDHPLKALRHELRLHRLCQEVVLEPFSELEVADFLGRHVPALRATESFVRALHARTEGLPLFVTNVVDDWIAHRGGPTGAETALDESQIASLVVPENLAGIIDKQVSRLPAEQVALLEVASVCGVEFRPAVVAEALERDAAWAERCCDELAQRRQWLVSVAVDRLADGALDSRYTFRHALYRQVFYQRLGVLARAKLHRQVAVSLERGRSRGLAVTAAELASHFELGHDPMATLRYHAEAAGNALRRVAPAQALSLAMHGLELLPQATEGPARDALELSLAAFKGAATAHSQGFSSLGARHAFEHARRLLDRVPQHPLRALVLHALGLVLMLRGEYAQARAVAERADALSVATGDRALFVSACVVLGQVHSLQGRYALSRDWLERGIAACEELGEAAVAAAFLLDPAVSLHATLVVPLVQTALPEQARAQWAQARERARRVADPIARMVAAWYAALLHVRLRDAASVAALADEMREIVDQAAIVQGQTANRWYRGWAQAQQGEPLEGFRQIRQGHDENMRLGMRSGGTEVLGYAAEALLLAGDWAAAQRQLDEARRLVDELGERVYLPQLLELQARIASARSEPNAALEALREAVFEARRQDALWLELSALTAICERDDAPAEDVDSLAAAYSRLTEGFDTALVVRSRELLRARGYPAATVG